MDRRGYLFIPNDSVAPAVVLVQVMACVPFSLETNPPLFPLKETVPSGLLIQSNCSQGPMAVRLQVIAWAPFSEDTYLLRFCNDTLPPPASTTRNCSHDCATALLQVIACVAFSLLTYLPLDPFSVTVCPMGMPPPFTTGWVGRFAVNA